METRPVAYEKDSDKEWKGGVKVIGYNQCL
jgi:hypothetical protein